MTGQFLTSLIYIYSAKWVRLYIESKPRENKDIYDTKRDKSGFYYKYLSTHIDATLPTV